MRIPQESRAFNRIQKKSLELYLKKLNGNPEKPKKNIKINGIYRIPLN